jgi:hypothetical protein
VFGPTGLVLAVPLTVVFYVLIKKLYVRETLGESTHVPGENAARGEAARIIAESHNKTGTTT